MSAPALLRLHPLVHAAPGLAAPAGAVRERWAPEEIVLSLRGLTPPEREVLRALSPPLRWDDGTGLLRGPAEALAAAVRRWASSPPPEGELGQALAATLAALDRRTFRLALAHGRSLTLGGGKVRIMGVLNVTPDSFSDGGLFRDPRRALEHGLRMIEAGADLVDIGGESTRPGAEPVPAAEELDRVLPVLEGLRRRTDALLSIDTRKAVVAREALMAGAHLVNDVSAFQDPDMPAVVRRAGAAAILMHMRGDPRTMQQDPRYGDVVVEVTRALREALHRATAAGVSEAALLLDPGIGFGKRLEHNVALLHHLPVWRSLGRPLCLGVSRKSFLGELTGEPVPARRLAPSLGVAAWAVAHGVEILRVHDVAETRQVVAAVEAVARGWGVGEGGRS